MELLFAGEAGKNILIGLANGAWIGFSRFALGYGKNLAGAKPEEVKFDPQKMIPSLVISLVIGGIAGASGASYDKIETIGAQFGLTYIAQDALKIILGWFGKK